MTTNARSAESFRMSQLAHCTKVLFSHLRTDEGFKNIVEKIPMGYNNEEYYVYIICLTISPQVGGGGTLIFSYICRLRPLLGQNLKFQYFLGFSVK